MSTSRMRCGSSMRQPALPSAQRFCGSATAFGANQKITNPVCRFSGEEAGQLARRVAEAAIEEDGEGVAERLAEEPTGQMPGIAGPDALGVITLDELAEDRLDPIANRTQEAAAGGI